MGRSRRNLLWQVPVIACLGAGALPAGAAVSRNTLVVGSTVVHYELVLPDHYDPQRPYPAILGFGGGPQTMPTVERLIDNYLRDQAEKRGYIVIAPAAPDNMLFFEGGQRIFPRFLEQILSRYRIEGGKFQIAGVSNGGISAFYIASLYPRYFLSITAFPGFLPNDESAAVRAISGLCVNMFVGQLDPMGWQGMMSAEAKQFRAAGMSVRFSIEPGQYHVIESLAGPHATRLFNLFDQDRHGCATSSHPQPAHQ